MYICSQRNYFICEIRGQRSHKTLKGRDEMKRWKRQTKFRFFHAHSLLWVGWLSGTKRQGVNGMFCLEGLDKLFVFVYCICLFMAMLPLTIDSNIYKITVWYPFLFLLNMLIILPSPLLTCPNMAYSWPFLIHKLRTGGCLDKAALDFIHSVEKLAIF